MPSQRITFENEAGVLLAGIIDLPDQPVTRYALFAHCFTCTKDLKAIVKISRGLAKQGIAVLRFDFTGLGGSGGVFADSNFETNVADIQAAVRWLSENHQAPQLLIGHSLGGTAMIATASQIPSAACIVTLASPANTHHLVQTLYRLNPAIEQQGFGEVVIGGRTHMIRKTLLDSLQRRNIQQPLNALSLPHLILHSPTDETLPIDHADEMFAETGRLQKRVDNYRAYVTLPGSDHLLVNQPEDINFVVGLIANWGRRFC